MAHGSGPRARLPHQAAKAVEQLRRSVLGAAHVTRIQYLNGDVTESQVQDAERWAAHRRACYRRQLSSLAAAS